jgi:hypothetical protein
MEVGVVVEAESGRARLLKDIETRRRAIEQYLDAKRPVSNRLTTISVISSCVAAALAAGPAVGGNGFADAVQNGLPIGQSSTVWRLLCFAAVAASIAAAISANLSKSSDLAERVAAAEAANGLLDGLRARMRFSRLPVADAAQHYQEIIARIPWVSDSDEDAPGTDDDKDKPSGGRKRSPIRRRPAPFLLGTTVVAGSFAVIAVVGLVAGLVRGAPNAPSPPASPGAAPLTQAAGDPVTAAVVPVARQVFSGPIAGSRTSLAIVVDGGRAAAYLCDGQALEAWFEGEVVDGRISLAGRNGAALTGTIDGQGLSGTGSARGKTFDFGISPASAPAGVYEAKINGDGGDLRMGWAVLPGGQQVGMSNRNGQLAPAPPLTLPGATFELGGVTYTAKLIGGTDDVVPS